MFEAVHAAPAEEVKESLKKEDERQDVPMLSPAKTAHWTKIFPNNYMPERPVQLFKLALDPCAPLLVNGDPALLLKFGSILTITERLSADSDHSTATAEC